ncbi:unnamed protein product [Dracunculus medinensis]|uniref:Malectin domain-containing protein n=1 Tax=Dracunculus medinensis TaxID=318479 RepID=A0A0N4U1H9_DRAME|nr:unnamed protein product [Dracunculus medinensis]
MGMVRGLGCEHEINLAKFRSNLVLFRCVEEYLDLRTKIFLVMMFCYYLFICLLLFFEIQCENVNFANNVIYAINCGGFYHKDIHGVEYEEDTEQTVGTTSDYGLQLNILRTDPFDAVLYQTERYHTDSFTYELPLPKEDGEYTLVLKFCEVYFRAAGKKVFDVLLNGEIIIPNLDIFNEAKGTGIAYDRLIGFYVLFLRKKFLKKLGNRDNPKINAFYLYRGPKTDIPKIVDEDFTEMSEGKDLIEEEEEIEKPIYIGEPTVKDPYADQDTAQLLIPFLIAFACFFPIVYCLCKI